MCNFRYQKAFTYGYSANRSEVSVAPTLNHLKHLRQFLFNI